MTRGGCRNTRTSNSRTSVGPSSKFVRQRSLRAGSSTDVSNAVLTCRHCRRRGLSLPRRWAAMLTGVIKMDDRPAPVAILPYVATSDGNKKGRNTAAKWTVATIATTFHKLRIYRTRRVRFAGGGGNLGNTTGEACHVPEDQTPMINARGSSPGHRSPACTPPQAANCSRPARHQPHFLACSGKVTQIAARRQNLRNCQKCVV